MSMPDPGGAPVAAPAGWEHIVGAIGPKVRENRQQLGLSLQQLASRADVSAAAIHKVERGDMVPTITTLLKLATALGQPIVHFVDDSAQATPAAVHVKAGSRPAARPGWAPDASGAEVTGLTALPEDLRGTVLEGRVRGAAVHAVIAPGGSSGARETTRSTRRGEELLLVLDGELAVEVAGEHFLVAAGDTLHYPTDRPHGWRNPGESPARAVWWLLDD
jgi:transcriptional regulator with XRE-family HTH domain